MSDRTTIDHSTIAEQRKDLLRQVVFNRAAGVPADQKLLFSAECGLTVTAFSAEFYAAALFDLDPGKAEEVAQELVDYLSAGPLPAFAWARAVELGYDPQEWVDEWEAIQAKRFPKPEASQFLQVTCFELRCALCDYVLDEEGEGIEHHKTQEQAEESALSQGWHHLADGRLICAADEEDHKAALVVPEAHVEVDGQVALTETLEG